MEQSPAALSRGRFTTLCDQSFGADLAGRPLAAPAAVAVQQADDKPAGVKLVGNTWVRTELFFGTDKPGPDVTDYHI